MVRKNDKEAIVNYENSILKSNEISMAKLNKGLTLNQMQLLAFAIYSTQKNGKTEFQKVDFEEKFNIEKYQTIHAKQDAQKLLGLQFSIEDLENDYFEYWNVFGSIRYKEGLFTFRWNEDFVPHILELKEKYIVTDLTITSNFRSGFSWILYDYLKAHYGYWHKTITKDALMKLFGVEDVKSYVSNTGLFKKKVLDVAIHEINQHTELQVHYKEERKGRSIVAFDIHWSNGTTTPSVTRKQITELRTIVDAVYDSADVYLSLNDLDNLKRAIQLVREVESFRGYTTEPISITSEYANNLLQKANASLRELERMLEYERQKPKVSFYDWLTERE